MASYTIRIGASARVAIRAGEAFRFRRHHAVLDLLETQPEIGRKSTHPRYGDVRVLMLRRTRYRLMYELQPTVRQVWIHQLRHASKRPLRARRATG